MGKMIRNEGNIIRPRRSTNIWSQDSLKPTKGTIFKIAENDFAVTLPHGSLSYPYTNNTLPPKKTVAPENSEFKNQLENYCEKTTLHGLRYVGDSHLSFGERIFWFISFSLAVGFAAYYISNIYAKWKSSPVIISFSPFDAELSSIPFPAITICNMNQAKKSEAEKILREGTNVEKKLLDDACNGNATFDNTENITWESLRDFLVRVGNSCSDILKSCQWGSDQIDCDEVFNNDLTDEGLCCSFNRLPPKYIFRNTKDISILNQTYPDTVYDWDPEKGYASDEDGEEGVPRRPLGAGAHLGLSVILDAQVENYYCSSTRSTGFKVILSNPIETPKMADFGFLISPGFETRVSVDPSVREATSSLRSIPIEKRQCYFSNERPLQYYRKYSKKHCQMECQSSSSLLKCDCVPYYLPTNDTSKYCLLDNKCVGKTRDLLDIQEGHKKHMKGRRLDCKCLPGCFSLFYTSEKSTTPIQNFTETQYSEKYIRAYTQMNCLQECQSNITLRHCNCIPFYLPKSIDTQNCEKNDDLCTNKVKRDIEDLKNGSFLDGECQCKPGCFELNFSTKFSSSPLYRASRDLNKIKGSNISRSYTQRNCNLECQSNHTLSRCLCVPYYLPKNKSIRYCGKTEKECVERAKQDMERVSGNGSSCHCLPSCFFVKYTQSKSLAKLSEYNDEFPSFSSRYYVKNMAVVHFYFWGSKFTKELKSELYGFTEILSNIGGLLSLCLGFSFLSLIELLYFVTLRVVCDLAKKHTRSGGKKNKGPVYPFLR